MFAPDKYESAKPNADYFGAYTRKLIANMDWNKGGTVLDYGCGTGSEGFKWILPQIKTSGGSKIHAVDVSEDMINFAKVHYPDSMIDYTVGDIMDNDFGLKDVKFDNILSLFVLHWMEDYGEALKRMYGILKPGGQLGFVMVTDGMYFETNQRLLECKKWESYMQKQYCPVATPDSEVRSAIDEIGFEVMMLESSPTRFEYNNIDTALDFFLSLNPAIKVIPQRLHKDLKKEYREILTDIDLISPDSKSFVYKSEVLAAVIKRPN